MCYAETIKRNGSVYVRKFREMSKGTHYKLYYFAIDGKRYPIGSLDVLCKHEIDWANTAEISGETTRSGGAI